jgi:hypothetical protein
VLPDSCGNLLSTGDLRAKFYVIEELFVTKQVGRGCPFSS